MFSQNVNKKQKKKIPKNMLNSHDHWAYNGLNEKKKRYLKQKPHLLKFLDLSSNLWKKK